MAQSLGMVAGERGKALTLVRVRTCLRARARMRFRARTRVRVHTTCVWTGTRGHVQRSQRVDVERCARVDARVHKCAQMYVLLRVHAFICMHTHIHVYTYIVYRCK